MWVTDDLAPRGVLRAAIDLGNPVLAQGTAEAPSGVTVDLARDLAERLGVRLETRCFEAAKDSFAALRDGDAEIGFLAIDPVREADVAFTSPYAVIEDVYAVPTSSRIADAAEVDRPEARIGVKDGSAYDLHLTRAVEAATLVRGQEGATVAAQQGLEVAAGIRVPLTEWAGGAGWRILEPAFMQIRQAVAVRRGHDPATLAFLVDWIEARKADGFVAEALARSGRRDALVAPPA
ncbi:transporter substrate-binding domain-containing protein [uncultured Amnibacterium sp.]|uniref:transporter substrate-binding domain-containing protein n=1 Tax=uncultured Amnibacterium sp. TaxID=1631851 RepID=UPI0035C9893F